MNKIILDSRVRKEITQDDLVERDWGEAATYR